MNRRDKSPGWRAESGLEMDAAGGGRNSEPFVGISCREGGGGRDRGLQAADGSEL